MAGGTTGGVYYSFAQLCAAVYVETARPDLVQETQQAVAASTLKLHTFAGQFFYKDLVVANGKFDSFGNNQQAYLQTLDTTLFPRYRSLSFLRKWDSSFNASEADPTVTPPQYSNWTTYSMNGNLRLKPLEVLDPTDLMDDYHQEKVDVCYQAGNTIFIKSSTPLSEFVVGFYQYPLIDAQNEYKGYTSWIAQEYPWAIIFDAAAAIYSKIGQTDSAVLYGRKPDQFGNGGGLAWDHIQAMLNSNQTAKGN
jgi:hypothetical protein